MNIYRFETKAHLKSTIIWIISLILVSTFFIILIPSFLESKEQFLKMLESYPKEFLTALGFNILDFSEVNFYSYILNYIILAAAVQATNLGLTIISKESRNKTMDFLLTKPVSRFKIMLSKMGAGFTLLIFTNIVYSAVIPLIMNIVTKEGYDLKTLILINLVIFFIQIIFFMLGVFIANIKTIKSVIGVSMATTLGLYIVSMLQSILELDFIKFFTPFKYFNTSNIASTGSYESTFIIFSIMLVILFTISNFIIYTKKDIHAV